MLHYDRQARGADRAGADVEYRVGGGVSCGEAMVGGTSMVGVSISIMGQG